MTRGPGGRTARASSEATVGGGGVMKLGFLVRLLLRFFEANLGSVLQRTRDDTTGAAHDLIPVLDPRLDLHVLRVADAGLDRDHLDGITVAQDHDAQQSLAIRTLPLALLLLVDGIGRPFALRLF